MKGSFFALMGAVFRAIYSINGACVFGVGNPPTKGDFDSQSRLLGLSATEYNFTENGDNGKKRKNGEPIRDSHGWETAFSESARRISL